MVGVTVVTVEVVTMIVVSVTESVVTVVIAE